MSCVSRITCVTVGSLAIASMIASLFVLWIWDVSDGFDDGMDDDNSDVEGVIDGAFESPKVGI